MPENIKLQVFRPREPPPPPQIAPQPPQTAPQLPQTAPDLPQTAPQPPQTAPQAPPPVENEANANSDPHQSLPMPVVEDFDSIAVINAWARLEKKPARAVTVYLLFLMDCIMVSLEVYFLVEILFDQAWVFDKEVFEFEKNITLLVLIVTSFANLAGKLFIDGSTRNWYPLKLKEVLKFFGMCQIHTARPFRYVRTIHYWHVKNQIVGKSFTYGETVTKEEVMRVTEINKGELIIARDDLYETFIQGIPMALVQCYLFINVESPLKICNARDVCQLFYIIFQLIGAVKCIMIYEWRKRVYANSLHVLGYLLTNGRFPIPDLMEDRVTIGLRIIIHSTSILARFFLIAYMSTIHWSVGAASVGLLFVGNCMAMFISPSALSSTIQNLPVGVSIPASYLPDHWINVFTAKETRFYELTREPMRTRSGVEIRFPLVIAHTLPFLLTFSVLYTSTIMFQLDKLGTPPGSISPPYFRSLRNETCPYHNSALRSFDLYEHTSIALYNLSRTFRMCFREGGGMLGFLSLSPVLVYLQLVIVYAYGHYKHKFFETLDTCYPILLTCSFFKKMVRSIYERTMRDNILRICMLKRLIFLMSIDLPTFNRIYQAYYRLSLSRDDLYKWWDKQIITELETKDPGRVSHRQLDGPPQDITGTPITSELEDMLQIIQNDELSLKLFLYYSRRFERVLSCEMTASRLTKTFGMLGLSKSRLCIETVQVPLVEQAVDVDEE